MNVIDKILYEQDIDLGVGKELFDNDFNATLNKKKFEENIYKDFSQNYFLKIKEDEKVTSQCFLFLFFFETPATLVKNIYLIQER
jgi:hypothetical protein